MNTDTKIILGAIVVSMALIFGAVVVLGNDKTPRRENLGQASMTIDKIRADVGSMKVSDEKAAVFTVTNTSKETLRLWNVKTSCDCTSAKVTIGSEETPEFSMHGGLNNNWIGEVPEGKQAVLTVIYRPSIMPVQGPVTRNAMFETNDPKNPNITVTIAANVQ